MMRKAVITIVLLCFFSFANFTADAEDFGCSFALTDVNAEAGKIICTTLSIKSEGKIASFVGEIFFDETMVEYREAKTADGKSLVSVNTKEKGRITFVYLCEEGVCCSSETEIIKFNFKAKTSGNSKLTLGVRDVIDSYGNDVPAALTGTSSVVITNYAGASNEASYTASEIPKQNFSEGSNTTIIRGNSADMYLIGSLCAAAAVAVVASAYVFYKIGVRKQRNESDSGIKGSEEFEKET